ncbi:hypothetical protein Tco_1405553 [Tanacetum coccineum]
MRWQTSMLKTKESIRCGNQSKQYVSDPRLSIMGGNRKWKSWVPIPVTTPESGPSTALKVDWCPLRTEEKFIARRNDVTTDQKSSPLWHSQNEQQLTLPVLDAYHQEVNTTEIESRELIKGRMKFQANMSSLGHSQYSENMKTVKEKTWRVTYDKTQKVMVILLSPHQPSSLDFTIDQHPVELNLIQSMKNSKQPLEVNYMVRGIQAVKKANHNFVIESPNILQGEYWTTLLTQQPKLFTEDSRSFINALGYSTFRCNPDLGVLQIGIRAKVIENQQSCLLHHPLSPTLPSTLTLSPAHDPNYVPDPVYPEYIPLEDEHVFPDEEQPLPLVDSPTAESPGYITELDLEEDPEEYEDDETEDGPVDYPIDGGDDGDDDDDDSSRDDADDEDEDDEDEEEEHLALADSTIVVPTDEPVSPPEGIEPAIPSPSTDISTTGARIIVRLQASISLPLEAEVERLLAMTTPLPSPPISLSPPFARERLARCMAPPAHSSPPHVSSPLLPSSGCPIQIQTLRIASTQALIDAVTTALPSPPLPPPLYIPPPVDHRDDIPESEQPPRKRLCLSTLSSRYEIGESSTARPIGGRGIDYGFFNTVDAEERWIVGDSMDCGGGGLCFPRGLGSLDMIESGTATATKYSHSDTAPETLRVTRDMRREMSDMQAELLAHREQQGRARQLGPDAWIPNHQNASGDADSHV